MFEWLRNWRTRHRHPVSLVLHAVGIPLTIGFVPLAIAQWLDGRWDLWWRPAVLLIGGYLLQWVGHRIEGNDMGEVIVLKRWMDRPYVAVSPRYANAVPGRPDADSLDVSPTHDIIAPGAPGGNEASHQKGHLP
ncbi:MAG: Mpo1-like protein [Phycisphaerae bacterium]